MKPNVSDLGASILRNREPLARGWLGFARTLMPAAGLSDDELLDSIPELLDALAANMDAPQTDGPQRRPADGERMTPSSTIERYSRSHAGTRLSQGFRLEHLVLEYRTLRTNILRCWVADRTAPVGNIQEVIHLDESIDRCLFESIAWFSGGLSSARDLFLGVLGHDLRSPLAAIATSATLLLHDAHASARTTKIAAQVAASAERMSKMVHDLLDFARTRMGGRLPIVTVRMALAPLLSEAVEEARAALPDAIVRCAIDDPLQGDWDADRMCQLVANLIINAYQHGAADKAIDVVARTEEQVIVISVHNEGPAIPDSARTRVFEPLMQSPTQWTDHPVLSGSIGLGLYICREIARAHGGEIEVDSAPARGTTFAVRIPIGLKERRH